MCAVHALQGNDSLTSLGLRDNAIGPVGMQRLALLLASPTCKLSELQIKGNAIGDDGASALADALGDNTSMRVCVVVSGNGCVWFFPESTISRVLVDNDPITASSSFCCGPDKPTASDFLADRCVGFGSAIQYGRTSWVHSVVQSIAWQHVRLLFHILHAMLLATVRVKFVVRTNVHQGDEEGSPL